MKCNLTRNDVHVQFLQIHVCQLTTYRPTQLPYNMFLLLLTSVWYKQLSRDLIVTFIPTVSSYLKCDPMLTSSGG